MRTELTRLIRKQKLSRNKVRQIENLAYPYACNSRKDFIPKYFDSKCYSQNDKKLYKIPVSFEMSKYT